MIENLEKINVKIMLDTNVLLNIYEYQPEYIEFACRCLNQIKKYILLPSIVCSEYEKNYRQKVKQSQNKYTGVKEQTIKLIGDRKKCINDILINEKNRRHYPEIAKLNDDVNKNFENIVKQLEKFFIKSDEDNDMVIAINNVIDDVSKFYDSLIKNKQYLPGFNQREIYSICLEGEKRYKQKIPPGFSDSTKKDGIRKYRFAMGSRGKSSGARVCYVDFIVNETIYLIDVFSKNEKINLSDKDKNELKDLIKRLKDTLKK